MDCLIIHNGHPPKTHALNGSLMNAFEYYIAIRQFNKSFKLVLVNFSQKYIEALYRTWQQRYVLLPEDWKKDIVSLTRSEAPFQKYDRVFILDYGTTRDLKGLILAKEITILSEGFTYHPDYYWDESKYNVKYFAEMPFERGEKYRMKILFPHFKKIDSSEEGFFVSAPDYVWFNETEFLKEIKEIKNKKYFLKLKENIDNLFSKFDTLIYYKSRKKWDCHPRLMLESSFYNKKIIYYNKHNIKDGSYYRYKDLNENGLKDRIHTKEDKIIQRLI